MKNIRNKLLDFKNFSIFLVFFLFGNIAIAQLSCGQNIDFNTWTQEGVLTNGDWNVQAGGSAVQQSLNGNPTWFVSPNDFYNVLIEGSIQVNTTSDDDFVGFVFGYQNPIGPLATPNNTYVKTFLFDWKQNSQFYQGNTGFEGFALMELDGLFDFVSPGPTGIFQTLWARVSTASLTTLDTDYANNGWNDNQQYNFQLKYTADSIVIWIDNVKIFEETGCYEPGRFGFYNLSQGSVNYSNFSYNIEYDFEMSDTIVCTNNPVDLEIGSGCLAILPPSTTFNWDFGDNTTATGIDPSHTFSTPGIYDIQLFASDPFGCIDSSLQTVEVLPYPISNAGIDDTSCTLSYNLSVSPNLGSWTGPAGVIFASTNSANTVVTVPSPGTYTFTWEATNDGGCFASDDVEILFNDPDVSAVLTDPLCNSGSDGEIQLTVQNLVGPIAYQWNANTNNQTSNTATNLSSGTYSVSISNGFGCTVDTTYTLAEPTVLNYTIALTPSDCDTGTGSATISTISGGTAPYQYDWGLGATPLNSTSNAPIGTYNVTISDFNGCDSTFAYTILPNPFVANITNSTDVTCFGANDGTATVAGPTPMAVYTYQWGPSSGSQTTATATNLGPGIHTVTVSTSNGCSDVVTVTISEPLPLSYTMTVTPTDCDTGTGTATISNINGGTTPYEYDWGGGPTPLNANSSITAGTFNMTISDLNGCDSTFSYTIVPNPFIASIPNSTNVTCFGADDGTATAAGPNVGGIYTYQWGASSGSQTTATATNLSPGLHAVTVSTSVGCTDIVDVLITEPSELVITQTSNFSVCIGETVTLSATVIGGTTPYSYSWGSGIGAVQNPSVVVNQNEYYVVTIMDDNGCIAIDSASVDIFATPIPSFSVDTLFSCMDPLHEFTFTNTSTPAGLSTSWDFGDFNLDAGDVVSHTYASAGLYTVSLTVTDATGCTVTLTEPNLVSVFENPIAAFTFDPNSITTFNSTVDFTDESYYDIVSWNWDFDGQGTSTAQNPMHTFPHFTGDYLATLEVTNFDGCVNSISESIHVRDDMTIYAPNAFTPDGDQHNQNWRIYATGFDLFDLEITLYNRWGEIVWKSFDIEVPWDGTYNGKIVPDGVYTWTVTTKSITNDERFEFNGHVLILR